MENPFPLRNGFFRGPPLDESDHKRHTESVRQMSGALLRQAFGEKWRYVPLDKDGVQFCKDTSNMEASYRLVRASVSVKCTDFEIRRLLTHVHSDSFRSFMKKAIGRAYVDSMVLHNILLPRDEPQQYSLDDILEPARLKTYFDTAVLFLTDFSAEAENHTILRKLQWMPMLAYAKVGSQGDVHLFPEFRTTTGSHEAVESELSALCSAIETRCRAKEAQVALLTILTSSIPDWCADAHLIFKRPILQSPNEVITAKWLVLDPGVITLGKRDFCIVDHLSNSQGMLLDPDGDQHEREDVSSSNPVGSPATGYWCAHSIDGPQVGCMSLKDAYNIPRTDISKFGLFWRPTAQRPGEMEVVACGSLGSKVSRMVMTHVMTMLGNLEAMVEDLRIGGQDFVPRQDWVKDHDRSGCHLCMRNFHTIRRKHHCRMCGEVICSDCSIVRQVDLAVVGPSKLRLCKVCFTTAKRTPVADDRLNKRANVGSQPPLGYSGGSSTPPPHPLPSDPATRMSVARRPFEARGTYRDSLPAFLYDDERDPAPHSPVYLDYKHPNVHQALATLRDPGADLTNLCTELRTLGGSCDQAMFELLCELACESLACPLASISFGHKHTEYVLDSALHQKSGKKNPLDRTRLKHDIRLFAQGSMESQVLMVTNAETDKRVKKQVLHVAPSIRFFAGCPIRDLENGRLRGYICVADVEARVSLTREHLVVMERLTSLAVSVMESQSSLLPHGNACSIVENHEEEVQMLTRLSELTHFSQTHQNFTPSEYQRVAKKSFTATPEERMRSLLVKTYETQQQILNHSA